MSFAEGRYGISITHGYKRLRERGITIAELEQAIGHDSPEILEDYPNDTRGASCLVLGWIEEGNAIHVQIAYWTNEPLVVTVYRPDERFQEDLRTRSRPDDNAGK
jgi:hypothetical protein